MKLYFARKTYDLFSLRLLSLLCLAVVLLLPSRPATAQSNSAFTVPPLIGTATPKQIAQAKNVYLRHNIKPTIQDILPLVLNPELKPVAGAKYSLVADDAPASPTASVVTSTEQTVDLTLSGYSLSGTTGYPIQATPSNTDVIWSHDDSYLVFSSNFTGYYHLYAISSSGGAVGYDANNNPIYVLQLTGLSPGTAKNDDRYPSLLAPSDNSIAFCTDTNGNGDYHLVAAPFVSSGNGFTVNQANEVLLAPNLEVRHPYYAGDVIYFSGRPDLTNDSYNIFDVTVSSGLVVQISGPSTGVPGLNEDNPTLSSFGWLTWDSNSIGYTVNTLALPPNTPLTSTNINSYKNIWASLPSGYGVEELTTPAGYDNEHPQWTTGSQNDFVNGLSGSEDLFFDSNRVSALPPGNTGVGHSIYYYPAYSNLTAGSQITGPVAIGATSIPASAAAIANYPAYSSVIINAGQSNSEILYVAATNSSATALSVLFGTTYPHAAGEPIQLYAGSIPGAPQTEAVASEDIQVDTSDPTHAFDDTQVAVSALVPPYISVAYISNRYLIDHIYDNPLAISSLSDIASVTSALDAGEVSGDTTLDQEPTSLPTVPSISATGASEVLVSRLMDIDPPSLITFNAKSSEIVHVYPGDVGSYSASATATHYVPAGQDATFVVRLSDRQTGIGQAWLQIKDPESSTQDTTGLEHKVFTQYQSSQFHNDINEATELFNYVGGTANNPYGAGAVAGYDGANPILVGNQVATGSGGTTTGASTTITTAVAAPATTIVVASSASFIQGDSVLINSGGGNSEVVTITGIAAATNTLTVTATVNAHAVGEFVTLINGGATITANINQTPAFSITINSNWQAVVGGGTIQQFYPGDIIGIYSAGTVGPGAFPQEEAEITSIPNNTTLIVDESLVGSSPLPINHQGLQFGYSKGSVIERISQTAFDPMGQEIDCQAIDTSLVANDSATGTDQISANAANYYIPLYAPGIDDTGYFETTPKDTSGNTYWLQLQPLPSADQDNLGGTLYYATWNTPLDVSDYYIDVIAEDASTSANWRVYDDVWGFTTQNFQAQNTILVVNDYALPQKFFSRGGVLKNTVGSANGPAHLFGTESYWTDISNNISGWENFYSTADSLMTPAERAAAPTVALPLVGAEYAVENNQYVFVQTARITNGYFDGQYTLALNYFPSYTNGLGQNSYYDTEMTQVSQIGNGGEVSSVAKSQNYDIWRILARGPVPLTILQSYGGKTVLQPHYPLAGAPGPTPNFVAPSCVIWLSPYSGDVYPGPGTITDAATQTNLDTFLQGGGRLHIEGKDIGYALTDNGTESNYFYDTDLNNFAPNVYTAGNSAFILDDPGNADAVTSLNGSNAQADSISNDAFINWWNKGTGSGLSVMHEGFWTPTDNQGHTTSSPPSVGPLIVGHFQLLNGSVTARTDASLDCYDPPFTYIDTFNTYAQTELVGSGANDREVFYRSTAAAGSPYSGSIVSYSSFGIATISQDLYNLTYGPGNLYQSYNHRTNLIHNIVCAMRTGTMTGVVTASGNGSQPVANATVWAQPELVNGYNPPTIPAYTATTDGNGAYSIQGLVAGRYLISAYKEGYSFQHSAEGVDVHGGDSGTYNLSLTLAGNGVLKTYVVSNDTASLSAASIVGATSLNVSSTAGFAIGDPILIDAGTPTAETSSVTGVGSGSSAGTINVVLLVNAHATGASVSVTTTLTAGVAAGSTSLPVATLTGFSVGQNVIIGAGTATAAVTTVTAVVTGASPSLTVSAISNAYASGATVSVSSISATLTSAVAVGATSLPVSNLTGFSVGRNVVVDAGTNGAEAVTVTAIVTGATPSLTITPTTYAHEVGAAVNIPLIGATVTPTEVEGGGAPSPTLTALPTGAATFNPIASGVYTVTATLPEYSTASQTGVQITQGTTTTVILEIQPLPVTISGLVYAAGSGASASLTSAIVAGVTTLPVNGISGFVVGQTALIDPTSAAAEAVTITAVSGGANPTLTLADPTVNAHQNGAPIVAGTGIAGALVTLTNSAGTAFVSPAGTPYTATTGANGTYSITIPGGNIPLSTQIYVSGSATQYQTSNPPISIGALNLSQSYTDINIPLTYMPLPTTTPTISPNGGAFVSATTVTLADTQSGAVIYYTTDGNVPVPLNADTTQYVATSLSAPTVIGATSLPVNSVSGFTIGQTILIDASNAPTTETAVISGILTSPVPTLILSSPAAFAHSVGASVAVPIGVTQNTVITANAVAPGYSTSTAVSASFLIAVPTTAPTLTLPGGTFFNGTTVTLTDTQPGAVMYYTVSASTTLSAATPVGSTTLQVASITGFVKNEVVEIDAGTSQAEQVTVSAVTSGGLTVSATVNSHSVGATVGVISTPTVGGAGVTVYTAPITVSGSETINAIAVAPGYLSSTVVSGVYTVYRAVPNPVISPAAGPYVTAQTVTITDPLANAVIYYTINGSQSWTVYSGPLSVSASESVSAFASYTGFPDSGEVTAIYTIGQKVPTPTITPNGGAVGSGQLITLSETQSGSSVYYTTDGQTPVAGNPDTTLYSGPFPLTSAATVLAIATETGYLSSNTATATFTIGAPAAVPVLTPGAGQYTTALSVTITDATAGAVIYYTTNGSTPTVNSQVYSAPITVGATETINALALAPGSALSAEATATYMIASVIPTPTFTPPGGPYTYAQTVTISDSLAGTSIYYTLDGSTPTTASTLYTGAITVSGTNTGIGLTAITNGPEAVNAIAVETGYTNSAVASATYLIANNAPSPVFSPPGSTFQTTQVVTITDTLPNATVYYSTDGSMPTTTSAQYAGPITVGTTETLTAIAVAPGYINSMPSSALFTFSPPVVASFAAGLQLISLPASYPQVGLDALFGYSGVKLAVWDPLDSVYAVTPIAPADEIVAGQGYWVRFPQTITVTNAGTPAPTNAPFVISLKPGWNMVGDPFNSAVILSSVTANSNGTSESYTQASGTTNAWLGNIVYAYDSASNAYAQATELMPDQGYWVFAYQATNLSIPAPGGS